MDNEELKKNAVDLTQIDGDVPVEISFVHPQKARNFQVGHETVPSGIPKETLRPMISASGTVPIPTPDGRVVFVKFDDIPDGYLVQVVGRFSSESAFGKEHMKRAYASNVDFRAMIDDSGFAQRNDLGTPPAD
jgi:hypothetical protein